MVKKIFRFFLLLLILSVAAIFYQWNHLRLLINTAKEQLPRGLMLNHSQHYINTDGDLVLLNPVLVHNSYGILFKAESLVYRPPSLGTYWNLSDQIILSDYPATGEIQLVDLSIPVEQIAKVSKSPTDYDFLKILMLGCSTYSPPSIGALVNMGFTELKGNTDISYRFDSLASSIILQGSHKLTDFSSIEWQLELNDFNPNNGTSPYLVYGQWVMFDSQFLNQRDQLCASSSNSSVAEFQKRHVTEAIKYLEQKNVAPSNELIERYNLFVQRPENLTLSFSPATGIRIEKYNELSLSEKLDRLGIALNINGRAITEILKKEQINLEKNIASKKSGSNENKNIIKRPSVYRLRQLLDKRVELIDENKKRYRGYIKSVSSRSVELQIRQSGGVAMVRFRPTEIRSIELLK